MTSHHITSHVANHHINSAQVTSEPTTLLHRTHHLNRRQLCWSHQNKGSINQGCHKGFIGLCSFDLYSLYLLKLPPPPRAAMCYCDVSPMFYQTGFFGLETSVQAQVDNFWSWRYIPNTVQGMTWDWLGCQPGLRVVEMVWNRSMGLYKVEQFCELHFAPHRCSSRGSCRVPTCSRPVWPASVRL